MNRALLIASMVMTLGPPQPAGAWEIDASAFGVGPTGDGTAAAQAALDAAFSRRTPGTVVFSTGFNFTTLATYPSLTIECAGDANPLVRTAVGPGLYTTNAPGSPYPAKPVFGVNIRNCTFNDGPGLPGANLTIAEAQSFSLTNVHSYSRLAGAAFTATMTTRDQLAVSAVTNGTIAAGPVGSGMLIECPGCGLTSKSNSYPRVASNGTGAGGVGTYALAGPAPDLGSPTEMVGLVSWSWPVTSGNTTLPSAAILYLGATFDGIMTNGYAGGYFDEPAAHCAAFAGAGLILDTTSTQGLGKPNHDTFVQLYTPCANVGIAINNGADGTFLNTDQQFDNYGFLIGAGSGNAVRTVIIQPYFEGGEGPEAMRVGVGFDRFGSSSVIIGSGSVNGVMTNIVDKGANNCWQNLAHNGFEYCGNGKFLTDDASFSATPRSVPRGLFGTSHGFWVYGQQTVSALNASQPCGAGATGQIAMVSDASAPAFNASVVGGGSAKVMVMCNGSAWVVF
jgi:hypothetical protein